MRLPYIVVSYCIEQCLFCFLFDFVLVIITIVYGNNQGYVTVKITFSEQLIFQDGTLIIFMMSSIINHSPMVTAVNKLSTNERRWQIRNSFPVPVRSVGKLHILTWERPT